MKLQVIVGTTRPRRVTDRIAKWAVSVGKNVPDTDIELVDLRDYELPFLDEPMPPQYNPDRQASPEVKKWIGKLGEADGYAIVTPEYNRGYPGALKNALDYTDYQFARKPIALIAHGSTGGAQSVAGLRITIPGLQAVTVPQAAFLLDQIGGKIDENGKATEDLSAPEQSVKALFESLDWYARALKTARERE
jgi:NAD(P)H-dependent FMN reductase